MNRFLGPPFRWLRYSLALLAACTLAGSGSAAEPVALRAESFTVPPATQPLMFVAIRNRQDVAYRGSVAMSVPEGWRIAPSARDVALEPGETRRVPFTIERGVGAESNSYPIAVSATGAGTTVVRRQSVVCASAPYFKPVIDGQPEEWQDAIPVTFTTGGKKTVLSTYWSRRRFALLVAVEEDHLIGYQPQPGSNGFDAVQVAIAAPEAETGSTPGEKAVRCEFLLVWTGSGAAGQCFPLAKPGMKLADTQERRNMRPLPADEAQVAVTRKDGVTYYEWAIAFRPIRAVIRPGEGREFCFSVLVHDPDGTGVRDWGEAAGLWPEQRSRLAWSDWRGAKWGEKPPFDNKLRWGLCASKF